MPRHCVACVTRSSSSCTQTESFTRVPCLMCVLSDLVDGEMRATLLEAADAIAEGPHESCKNGRCARGNDNCKHATKDSTQQSCNLEATNRPYRQKGSAAGFALTVAVGV